MYQCLLVSSRTWTLLLTRLLLVCNPYAYAMPMLHSTRLRISSVNSPTATSPISCRGG